MSESLTVIDIAPGDRLIERALELKADVATMERLLAMRRELKAEAAKEAFDRALATFQGECPAIQKTKRVMGKDGRTVRYCYAPLEVIVAQAGPVIQRHGFSYTLDSAVEAEWVTAICQITHSLGHAKSSTFKVPIDPDSYMNAPQRFASALTFAKRYAFCNAFGILTCDEDDDSQSAGEATQRHAKRPAPLPRLEPLPMPGPAPKAPPAVTQTPAQPRSLADRIEAMTVKLGAKAGWACGYLRAFTVDGNDNSAALMPMEELADLSEKNVVWLASNWKQFNADLDQFIEDNRTTSPPTVGDSAAVPAAGASPEASVPPVPLPYYDLPDAPWRFWPISFGKHAGVTLGKVDRKALWSFWKNFSVEKTYNGKARSKEQIAKDEQFRVFLDDAGNHLRFENTP